jgi:hypothetical protein
MKPHKLLCVYVDVCGTLYAAKSLKDSVALYFYRHRDVVSPQLFSSDIKIVRGVYASGKERVLRV